MDRPASRTRPLRRPRLDPHGLAAGPRPLRSSRPAFLASRPLSDALGTRSTLAPPRSLAAGTSSPLSRQDRTDDQAQAQEQAPPDRQLGRASWREEI